MLDHPGDSSKCVLTPHDGRADFDDMMIWTAVMNEVRQLEKTPCCSSSQGVCSIDMVSTKFATLLAACLIVALTLTLLMHRKELRSSGCFNAHLGKTLVVHIFADNDPEYLENLKFFVQYGILQEDNADYIILVQANSSTIVRAS